MLRPLGICAHINMQAEGQMWRMRTNAKFLMSRAEQLHHAALQRWEETKLRVGCDCDEG